MRGRSSMDSLYRLADEAIAEYREYRDPADPADAAHEIAYTLVPIYDDDLIALAMGDIGLATPTAIDIIAGNVYEALLHHVTASLVEEEED